MRFAIDAQDVSVSDDVLLAVDRAVSERAGLASFAGARDLRLRLRQTKNALLCVAAVGFAGGALVTSTATRTTPLEAIVGALDELPQRVERFEHLTPSLHDREERQAMAVSDESSTTHAAVRDALRRLWDTA